jgi:hypothetical protein
MNSNRGTSPDRFTIPCADLSVSAHFDSRACAIIDGVGRRRDRVCRAMGFSHGQIYRNGPLDKNNERADMLAHGGPMALQ